MTALWRRTVAAGSVAAGSVAAGSDAAGEEGYLAAAEDSAPARTRRRAAPMRGPAGQVERLLPALVALMAVLGTAMLGVGGETPHMTPLVTLAAVCGVLFTDWLGWFHMPRLLVNVVAVGAMVVTLRDFLESSSARQLIAIAYLLICWEVVMLFQRKTVRVYWCIAVLSLLQVVVAAVINDDLQYAVLLVPYLAAGFSAMVLLFIHGELLRCALARRRWRAGTTEGPLLLACGEEPAEALGRRVPRGTVVRHLLGMGLSAALFAVVFFYATPRRSSSGWRHTRDGATTQTGFSQHVSLRSMGEILQSNQLVMRVALYDHRTGRPYTCYGEPYWSGSVLTRYHHGQWSATPKSSGHLPRTADPQLMAARTMDDFVRMQVQMEPTAESTLFPLRPLLMAPGRRLEIKDFPASQVLRRDGVDAEQLRLQYRFDLVTNGLRNGVQVQVRPHEVRIGGNSGAPLIAVELLPEQRAEALAIDRSRFPGLVRIAEETLAAETITRDNRLEQCRALLNHFLVPGRYEYTLDLRDAEVPRGLDPIEVFVSERRRGHCEYFASALALMLRSQGIPARLVVGYHGGDVNAVGQYFQVRQRHAHAWVEAYIEPEQVPEGVLSVTPFSQPRGGGWMRLDPTPSQDDENALRARLDDVLDYAQLLWNDFVLDHEGEEGADSSSMSAPALSRLLPLERWSQGARNWASRMFDATQEWLGEEGFGWRAGLLAATALGVLAGLWRGALWLWRRLPWTPSGRRRRARIALAPFYARLEGLLRRLGLTRGARETPREFAQQVAEQFADTPGLERVAEVPLEIAGAYYRVRFGGAVLDSVELQRLEHALRRLEEAVGGRRRGRAPAPPESVAAREFRKS